MNHYCLNCNKKITASNIKIKSCSCGNKSIKKDILDQKSIYKITKKIFNRKIKKDKFEYGKTTIPLSIPTYTEQEAFESMQSLLSTYVTNGQKVKEFENVWSKYSNIKKPKI